MQRLFRPFFPRLPDQSTLISAALADDPSSTCSPKKRSSLEKDPRIQQILSILSTKDVPKEYISLENISATLECNYANGNVELATELLLYFFDAIGGKIRGITQISPKDGTGTATSRYHRLMGADNRNGVTCYLDSLLFAMFARLESFEPMLQKFIPSSPTQDNDPSSAQNKTNLGVMLRLYVSLLRSGELITTDVTKMLLGAIIKAGWDESCFEQQQDCCDLFNFITDKLDMPMITLKLDIEHGGKENSSDDHKLVHERLLLVSVPPGSEPVLLEECLELYFANSIQVSRQLERRRTLSMSKTGPNETLYEYHANERDQHYNNNSSARRRRGSRRVSVCIHSPNPATITPVSSNSRLADSISVIDGQDPDEDGQDEEGEEDMRALLNKYQRYSNLTTASASGSPDVLPPSPSENPPAYNTACGSGGGGNAPAFTPPPEKQLDLGNGNGSATKNTLWNGKNEIMLPAWMFLQLVPFYTNTTTPPAPSDDSDSNSTSTPTPKPLPVPKATEQFATTRPVVGICLKRSEWGADGQSTLNTRQVLVPNVIHFPSFVVDDDDVDAEEEDSAASLRGKYVLVLESAVFHRGTSPQSGHFVALARENSDIPYTTDMPPGGATTTPSATPSRSQSAASSFTGDPHSRWVLFDDLLPAGEKVQPVDYDQVFQAEKPYILFYRLMTVGEYEHEGERHKSSSGGSVKHVAGSVSSLESVASSVALAELTPSGGSSSASTGGSTSLGGSISASKSLSRLRPHFTRTWTKAVAEAESTVAIAEETGGEPSNDTVAEVEVEVEVVETQQPGKSDPPQPQPQQTQQPQQQTQVKEKFRLKHLKQKSKSAGKADEYRNEKCVIA